MATLSSTSPYGLRKRSRYSARPFFLTIIVVLFIASFSWISKSGHHQTQHIRADWKRDFSIQDEECRLVHRAADKCAFVNANCADEEAGIFSYLSLYYCRLPHAKPVAFIILVLWLGLLFSTIGIAASDFFCVNLSTIASLLGMSESMAGVTFLAFGNGSPDVFSTFAAMSTNSGSLAIGELIGAAGFITAVVAGSMALVRPFKVARRSFVRDVSFFIFAASFSMVFLRDGKLYLWECATMIGFYIFYVLFVLVWHWWLAQRKARRQKAAAMRSHYISPGGDEEEIQQEYHDEDDGPSHSDVHTPLLGVSEDDFTALERADPDGPEEDDDLRERWLGELNSNMRLNRPGVRSRRNTHTPIRPSLVGALEFRAVLTSLQKSRNIQTIPINLRRYSDDPTYTLAQQQDVLSRESDPVSQNPYHRPPGASSEALLNPSADAQRRAINRARAVSTNDVDNARLDPSTLEHGAVPIINFGSLTSENARGEASATEHISPAPSLTLSPPPSEHSSRAASPVPPETRGPHTNRLAPPDVRIPAAQAPRPGRSSPSPLSSPTLDASYDPDPRSLPKLAVPNSPTTPFPSYSDYPPSTQSSSRAPSIRLPSPSLSPESFLHQEHFFEHSEGTKVLKWWPYQFLPPPQELISTLFPTLSSWRSKSVWTRLLGIVAAPSVFLLTITLPVVETQKNDDERDDSTHSFSLPATPNINSIDDYHPRTVRTVADSSMPSRGDRNSTTEEHGNVRYDLPLNKALARGSRDSIPSTTPQEHSQQRFTIATNHLLQSPEEMPTEAAKSTEQPTWNRWLVIIQAFTAPFFIILIVWANTQLDHPRALLKRTLYSLVFSLSMLAIILSTTTPNRPPRWRVLLCFLGFAVSISWISTIANEVVGVLKTLGVILNMSDAILGLTIFAVGNSLGDFVADITVARLGFPVMALSACFGGPMLNILLGIGISGCYMTIKGGQRRHEKHPDRPVKFKPYHIEVSTTLVISGATLLVTLIGLLVAVPLRRWKMDRTIGWGLVILWSMSTIANVIVEVLGLSSSVS